jgi:hypothetical protein
MVTDPITAGFAAAVDRVTWSVPPAGGFFRITSRLLGCAAAASIASGAALDEVASVPDTVNINPAGAELLGGTVPPGAGAPGEAGVGAAVAACVASSCRRAMRLLIAFTRSIPVASAATGGIRFGLAFTAPPRRERQRFAIRRGCPRR